jgi:hypothetical protein
MEAPNPTEVSAVTAGWFPVLTLLLGFAIKFLSDWIQNRRDVAKDRRTRTETRRDVIVDRRTTFQRATLLELQEAVQDLARAAGASHHQDEVAYRRTGEWQRELLGDELNDQYFATNRSVLLLNVRVRDESLRDLVNRFRTLVSQTASISGLGSAEGQRSSSNAALLAAMTVLEEIHLRIGVLLREMDDDEDLDQSTNRRG